MNLESELSTEREESREVAIDSTGNWLLVANQKFDAIVPYRLDPENGMPISKRVFNFSCGSPTYLLFLLKWKS